MALAIGLLASAAASFTPRASTQQSVCPQTGTTPVSISLDGVELKLCTPFIPAPVFSTADPADAIQMASAVDRSTGYKEFSITVIPFGLKSPAEDLPVAEAGSVKTYRALLQDYRTQQGGQPQPGPAAVFFGQPVTSTVSVVKVYVDELTPAPVAIAEWVAQAGDRLWIIRALEKLPPEGGLSAAGGFLAGLAAGGEMQLSSADVGQPSTSLAAAKTPAKAPSSASGLSAAAADLPAPSWWFHNGNYEECDYSHYTYDSANPTHRTPYRLGASYRGMLACGPRPYYDSAPDVIVQFFPGAWGELEWECVELSMRFMRQAYGIAPYHGNGKDVVWNYTGSELVKVVNGTTGEVPAPGDVLSYCSPGCTIGHTSVVAASNVNAYGNGSITIIEQNNTVGGTKTLPVVSWVVVNGVPVTGWLHFPGNGSVSGVVRNSGGQLVAGAQVTLEKWMVSRTSYTDGSGAYAFADIPAGSASVTASYSDGCRSAVGATTASIVAHQTQPVPDIVITDLTGSVSGVVRNTSGQPVPGAQVQFSKCSDVRTATTGSEGAYAFSNLPIGWASVQANYTNGSVNVTDSTSVNIVTNQNQQVDFTLNLPPWYDADFVADVTFPDQAVFSPGQSLVKTWRLLNSGAFTWGSGYQLVFVHGDKMGGAEVLNVPTTLPGQTADFTVNLTAPASGSHFGYWGLRNPQGAYFGPLIFPQVNVQAPSSYLTLQVSPPSPANTNYVRIYARADAAPNFGALRLKVDGVTVAETQTAELYYTWNTSGYSEVGHSLVVEATDLTDTAWLHAERRGVVYTLLGTTGAGNLAPDRPAPVSPADWSAITSTVQLCAQGAGTGLQYQFEISSTVNSGWVANCYSPAELNPGTYAWRAKTKDSAGTESLWSDVRHFSFVTGGSAGITRFDLEPLDPAGEQVRTWPCTSLTAPVTLSVRVNTTADGSGRWDVVDEQAVPCVTAETAPVWNTLLYDDGAHLLRVVATGASPLSAVMSDTVFTLAARRPLTPTLLAPTARSGWFSETVFLNSRTLAFRWAPAARAISYTLYVSVNPSPTDDAAPLVRQVLYGETAYTATLDSDYAELYWQVVAANALGASASGAQHLGIDRTPPSCTVQAPAPDTAPPFQVSWSATDDRSGISIFDLRYIATGYADMFRWLIDVPADVTSAQFYGQSGRAYGFFCLATDQAGNVGHYPSIFFPVVFK